MSTADSGKKYFNVPDIKDYCVSTDSGFLPSKRIPCKRLSNPYYERWEHLATNVQTLLLQGSFRKEVLQVKFRKALILRDHHHSIFCFKSARPFSRQLMFYPFSCAYKTLT